MDNNLQFNEQDKEKVVKFLNLLGEKANYNLSTKEVIEFFGYLTYLQKTLIPKIDANIFQIEKVVQVEEAPPIPEGDE